MVENIKLVLVNPNTNLLLPIALVRVTFPEAHAAENIQTVIVRQVFPVVPMVVRNFILILVPLFASHLIPTTAETEPH